MQLRIHRSAQTVAMALAVCALGACDDGGNGGASEPADGSPTDADARRMLVAHLGENVILPWYRDFENAAADLEEAAGTYAGSLAEEDLDAAQQAWRDAMAIWQKAELTQFGPAGLMSEANAGGQGLRDPIYSWPTTSACKVDQVTWEEKPSDSADFLSDTRVNARGLDALEYLLFQESPENECPQALSINDSGNWDSLSEEDIRQFRASYAAAAATDLHDRATKLVEAWESDGGDFLGELSSAGAGSTLYDNATMALEDIASPGMVDYMDADLKDTKLAVPSGISGKCANDACPDKVESPFAQQSQQHVLANLRGFQEILLGGEPGADTMGFDDLLTDLGAGDLAETLVSDTEAAIEAVEAIDAPLAEAVQSDKQSVVDAHDAVKKITDNLKSQFTTVLGIELVKVAGDTD